MSDDLMNVRCECKKCGDITLITKCWLLRDGFKCPLCGHEKYKIIL